MEIDEELKEVLKKKFNYDDDSFKFKKFTAYTKDELKIQDEDEIIRYLARKHKDLNLILKLKHKGQRIYIVEQNRFLGNRNGDRRRTQKLPEERTRI